MAAERIMKALANCEQGLDETQKAQARANIGAQAALTAGANITIDASTNTISSTASGGSHISRKAYGGSPVEVDSLLIDADDPDGYVSVSADSMNMGDLVNGPYKTLLDSGVTGVGDSSNPVYIDGNGEFQQGNPVGTSIVSRSTPYTTEVPLTGLTVYDPGQPYGSVISDQNSNNIGFLAPRHQGQLDLGKVLTIVSDDGYKMEWRPPQGAYPDLQLMGHTTVYPSNQQAEYLTLEDGVCYDIYTNSGGSFLIHIGTASTTTVHSKIYLWPEQQNCVVMTLVYEDEAGEIQQLNYTYGDIQDESPYALDIFARKVTVTPLSGQPYDEYICRVTDYPCQRRDAYSLNTDIGKVVNYVEPL